MNIHLQYLCIVSVYSVVLFQTYRDFFTNIPHTNAVTLIASVICMAMIYVVKEYINNNPKIKPKLKMPVPIELIAVSITVTIWCSKLTEPHLSKMGVNFILIIMYWCPAL